MGLAILLVMFFHSGMLVDEPFKTFRAIGIGGVDIFIFASGVGCHYSLSKNPDAISFFKRRAKRILPTWWTFLIIFWLLREYRGFDPPWQAFIGNALLVQGFADWHFTFDWYISAMLGLYLLAPYFSSFASRNTSLRSFLSVEAVLLAVTIPFWGHEHLMFISRLPIFYLGITVATLAQHGVLIDRRRAIGLLIATTVGLIVLFSCSKMFPPSFLSDFGLWWYPFILIVPGLCFGLSFILSRAPLLINKILSKVGGLSFELYLVHVFFMGVIAHKAIALNGALWLIFFVVPMIFSVGLKCLVTTLERRLSI